VPASKQASGAAPDLVPGDWVYVQHPKRGPIALRVTAVGKDGFRGRTSAGEKFGVPHADYLGHKARGLNRYNVVDQGADGAIVADHRGGRRYLEGDLATVTPPADGARKGGSGASAPEPEPDYDPLLGGIGRLQKALDSLSPFVGLPATSRLLVKAGPIRNRPGLQLKEETDKAGHQIHRWERDEAPPTPEKQPAAFKHGDKAKFRHGQVEGEGKIIASSEHGVTLRDKGGRDHHVRHEHLVPPEFKYPERQEGENDKVYLKRVGKDLPAPAKLEESHAKYFNDKPGTKVVPIDRLVSTKSDAENEKGGGNAPKFMAASAAGVVAKRDPITVRRRPDGKYDVVDGSGTFTGAKAHGWKSLPVQVDGEGEGDNRGPFFEPHEVESLPKKAVQPIADKDALFEASRTGLEDFKSWLNRGNGVASAAGAQTMTEPPESVAPEDWEKPGPLLFIAPLKSEKRAAEKVQSDYEGDWSRLTDTVRGSIAVDSLADVHDMVAKLRAGGMKLAQQPKDRFNNPLPVGYRDMLLNVTLPNGLVGELQLHVKSMLKAKNEGHKLYETMRTIEAKPEAQWTDAEKAAYQKCLDDQKALYNKAWSSGNGGSELQKAYNMAEKWHFFEHEGATFRRPAGNIGGVTDILNKDGWKPYTGNRTDPALYGDMVADPEGGDEKDGESGEPPEGQAGTALAKADSARLLLPASALAKGLFVAAATAAAMTSVPGHMRGGKYVASYVARRRRRMTPDQHEMAADQALRLHDKIAGTPMGRVMTHENMLERWRVALHDGELHPDDRAAILRKMNGDVSTPRMIIKAQITGGAAGDLFATPVHVSGHMRDGKYVPGYTAARHKRAELMELPPSPPSPGSAAARVAAGEAWTLPPALARESDKVPPDPINMLRRQVNYLQGVHQRILHLRQGGMTLASDDLHNAEKELIADAHAKIEKFRSLAAPKGIDTDKIIAEMGGLRDLATDIAGIDEWVAAAQADKQARAHASNARIFGKAESAWRVGQGVRCKGRPEGFQIVDFDADGLVQVKMVQGDPARPVGVNFDDAVPTWIALGDLVSAPEFDVPDGDTQAPYIGPITGAKAGRIDQESGPITRRLRALFIRKRP
jgi:hypothetical protein